MMHSEPDDGRNVQVARKRTRAIPFLAADMPAMRVNGAMEVGLTSPRTGLRPLTAVAPPSWECGITWDVSGHVVRPTRGSSAASSRGKAAPKITNGSTEVAAAAQCAETIVKKRAVAAAWQAEQLAREEARVAAVYEQLAQSFVGTRAPARGIFEGLKLRDSRPETRPPYHGPNREQRVRVTTPLYSPRPQIATPKSHQRPKSAPQPRITRASGKPVPYWQKKSPDSPSPVEVS